MNVPDAIPVIRSQTPMLQSADIERTAEFYAKLGFTIGNGVKSDDGVFEWVNLVTEGAALMFGRTEGPIDPDAQALLLYLYTDDVNRMHDHLAEVGVAVSEINMPFWAPDGEFEVIDPDGWCLMITHT